MSLLDLFSGFSARVADKWYGPPIIDDPTGSEEEYSARYHEVPDDTSVGNSSNKKSQTKILGKGEFGEVRLVARRCTNKEDKEVAENDTSNGMYAVKVICKGYSINDDNTVFSPPKPSILQTEVVILRCLQGERWNLRLLGVYEGHRYIYMITELCSGGNLHDFRTACLKYYRSRESKDDTDTDTELATQSALLPADIVREVSIRILHAVNHCSKHGVIHRDLKPANIMLVNKLHPDGDTEPQDLVNGLRLIDFGSGCIDRPKVGPSGPRRHTTMAGSAFYNSPEMFAKSYTYKTDVWSAGATIYAFAAGFPEGDRLQPVFDTMQKPPSKGERNLKEGMMPPPIGGEGEDVSVDDRLPNTFWKMLDESLLVYRHRDRPSAEEALKSCAFLQASKISSSLLQFS